MTPEFSPLIGKKQPAGLDFTPAENAVLSRLMYMPIEPCSFKPRHVYGRASRCYSVDRVLISLKLYSLTLCVCTRRLQFTGRSTGQTWRPVSSFVIVRTKARFSCTAIVALCGSPIHSMSDQFPCVFETRVLYVKIVIS